MNQLFRKNQVLCLAFLCLTTFMNAQSKDSIGIVKHSFYVRSMPLGVYAGAGFMQD